MANKRAVKNIYDRLLTKYPAVHTEALYKIVCHLQEQVYTQLNDQTKIVYMPEWEFRIPGYQEPSMMLPCSEEQTELQRIPGFVAMCQRIWGELRSLDRQDMAVKGWGYAPSSRHPTLSTVQFTMQCYGQIIHTSRTELACVYWPNTDTLRTELACVYWPNTDTLYVHHCHTIP
jgi:hypothetical protein